MFCNITLSKDELGLLIDSLKMRYEASDYQYDQVFSSLFEKLKTSVKSDAPTYDTLEQKVCDLYLDNVCAYINKCTIENNWPNERLMRAIEEEAQIPEMLADDFRKSVFSFIGSLSRSKINFTWKTHEKLKLALQAFIEKHPNGEI